MLVQTWRLVVLRLGTWKMSRIMTSNVGTQWELQRASVCGHRRLHRFSIPLTKFQFVKIIYTMDSKLVNKLNKIYYNLQGYWKGMTAIKKLSLAAKVPGDTAKKWLIKQAHLQNPFLAPNLMCPRQTLFTKPTFFSCRRTPRHVVGDEILINMR